MAVRFLPPPEERPQPQREDRGDLAEVIEFRSRLRRPEPAAADAGTGHEFADDRDSAGGPRADESADSMPVAPNAGAVLSRVAEDDEAGPSAYESAVKLLARKPLSTGELQRALVAAGHPEIDAEGAVATCVDSLYLDDADLATAVATKLREAKGESKARIRQKLRERHLPDAAIESALSELDDDEELELLRQTASDRARRMAGLDRQTAERRLLGFLARRGWSGERATRAAKDALDGVARGAGGGRGSVRFQ